jgi:glyoxylate/hydroxypyruvate reductase A
MRPSPEAGGTILFLSALSDSSWPSALQSAFPDHQVVTRLPDASPETTVAAVVWKHPYGSLAAHENLRVLVNLGAGVDHIIGDPALPAGVPIVRLVDPGLTARMTEYVLMHCLALHRRVPELRKAQDERLWQFQAPAPPGRCCVGILGFGKLGQACARSLSAVGFEVIGWKRTPEEARGFAVYSGMDGLREFCARTDILVILLPSTAATRDLVDQRFFDRMKAGAALINVGRGDLLVEADLLAALNDGHLRHAVLDVFRTEPLTRDHPFWSHPRITISPHNSSATDPATAREHVIENIRRAFRGDELLDRIDPAIGY